MNDRYSVLVFAGVGGTLPSSGRNPLIAFGEREQRRRILEMHPDIAINAKRRKLWVESHIAAFGPVIVLAIHNEPRVGKDRAHRQAFPPTGVDRNNIRYES